MPILNSKYMEAEEIIFPRERKTKAWAISNRSYGDTLAIVIWLPAWRQYVFRPFGGTEFSADCLAAVVEFLRQANAEHKQKQKEPIHV